jgi:arsenical pump membrane protein
MQETIAYGTMMVTLGLVLFRPRIGTGPRVSPGMAAALGVVMLLATGVVAPSDLVSGLDALWRPFITIFSMMLTTSVAQQLGLFDYVAGLIERRQGQSIDGVYRSVFAFSALTSAALNNDAAVLLLTPMVVRVIRRCFPDRPHLVVPFAFAVFSAAGVAPLVISNPMNLIVADIAGIGFNEYAARMIPIAVAGWVAAYAILRIVFRRQLREGNRIRHRTSEPAPMLSPLAKQFIGVLVAASGCYPVLSYAGGPVWAVAAASGTLGVWLCWHYGVASPGQLAAAVSWEILIFLFCVFVIILGLRNVGLVPRIAHLYAFASDSSAQIVVIALLSTIGSAILNNHPMAILNALAIRDMPGNTLPHVLAALIGGDLGPRLLPMGSLAGLLWLDLLRRQGIHIALSRFIRVGLAVTLPTLVLSLSLLLLSMQ